MIIDNIDEFDYEDVIFVKELMKNKITSSNKEDIITKSESLSVYDVVSKLETIIRYKK